MKLSIMRPPGEILVVCQGIDEAEQVKKILNALVDLKEAKPEEKWEHMALIKELIEDYA